jgi:dipeptidyl aminopeptidase/acylaminoacyl peptidase
MKIQKQWKLVFMLALLSLTLQSCLGSATTYKSVTTGKNGNVNINTASLFKGKIYFTLNGNLYAIDGSDTAHPKQLTSGLDVRDPSVSPNGKWIAFSIYYQNYSNLAYMPASGGKPTIIANGNGSFSLTSAGATSSYHWFEQPTWASDSETILFLGDNQKAFWAPSLVGGYDSFILDLQLFKMSMNDRLDTQDEIANAVPVAYTAIGAGGLRDPSYRPGHNDEVIYTSYSYTASSNFTDVNAQLNLIDDTVINNSLAINPYEYHPEVYGTAANPSVAITPGTSNLSNLEPSFSPDGNTIAYVRTLNETTMGLYTMPVPTDDTSTITTSGTQDLADYNKSSQLLTGEYLSQPVWSPDGTQIAYYSYTNTTFDLWIATVVKNPKTGAYSIKKGSNTQLTQANGSLDANSRPFWTS